MSIVATAPPLQGEQEGRGSWIGITADRESSLKAVISAFKQCWGFRPYTGMPKRVGLTWGISRVAWWQSNCGVLAVRKFAANQALAEKSQSLQG